MKQPLEITMGNFNPIDTRDTNKEMMLKRLYDVFSIFPDTNGKMAVVTTYLLSKRDNRHFNEANNKLRGKLNEVLNYIDEALRPD